MRKRSWKMFCMVIAILAGFWLWNASGFIPLQNHLCKSFIGLQQAISAPATKPATAGKSPQSSSSSPAAGQSQAKGHTLPLIVQRLYLKAGHVWIAIAGSGKGELDLEDYPDTGTPPIPVPMGGTFSGVTV